MAYSFVVCLRNLTIDGRGGYSNKLSLVALACSMHTVGVPLFQANSRIRIRRRVYRVASTATAHGVARHAKTTDAYPFQATKVSAKTELRAVYSHHTASAPLNTFSGVEQPIPRHNSSVHFKSVRFVTFHIRSMSTFQTRSIFGCCARAKDQMIAYRQSNACLLTTLQDTSRPTSARQAFLYLELCNNVTVFGAANGARGAL